jgi:hypothetical protein
MIFRAAGSVFSIPKSDADDRRLKFQCARLVVVCQLARPDLVHRPTLDEISFSRIRLGY